MKKRHIIYGVLVIVLVVAGIFFAATRHSQTSVASGMRTVQLDGQTVRVSIADNDASRELGLGGRAGLAPDEGMLFVFQTNGQYKFWMKDMRFSIDMVWIDAQGKIIYIAQNVAPETYPQAFGPAAPARYVLELPANYTSEHKVKVGDSVAL